MAFRICLGVALAFCMGTAGAAPQVGAAGPNLEIGKTQSLGELGVVKQHESEALKKAPYLRIAAWNLDHLGEESLSGGDRDIYAIGDVASRFDVLLLQGITTSSELDELARNLQLSTDATWRFVASAKVMRYNRVADRVAVLWRTDRIAGGRVLKLAPAPFEAQPLALGFNFENTPFIVMTILAANASAGLRGPDKMSPAIAAIADVVRANPEIPVFAGGTFGYDPHESQMAELAKFMRPAVSTGGSVLGRTDGRYEHLVDNIWTNLGRPFKGGIYDIPKVLGLSNGAVIERVSSHVPVFSLVDIRKPTP